MKRRFRVVSKVRFTTFIVLATLIFMLLLRGIMSNATAQTYDKTFIQVEVEENDTLWNMSQEFISDDVNIRKYIHEVCEINEIKAGDIKAGDLLIFPILDSEEA